MQNEVRYSIGDIVILLSDNKIANRYLVVATTNQKLDQDYLKSLTGKLNIKDVSKLADNVIQVTRGFKYKICKCAENYIEELCVLEGNFIDILDDEEITPR